MSNLGSTYESLEIQIYKNQLLRFALVNTQDTPYPKTIATVLGSLASRSILYLLLSSPRI